MNISTLFPIELIVIYLFNFDFTNKHKCLWFWSNKNFKNTQKNKNIWWRHFIFQPFNSPTHSHNAKQEKWKYFNLLYKHLNLFFVQLYSYSVNFFLLKPRRDITSPSCRIFHFTKIKKLVFKKKRKIINIENNKNQKLRLF